MQPNSLPSKAPSTRPSCRPSAVPSVQPHSIPSSYPSLQPQSVPSRFPSSVPSVCPTTHPSAYPSTFPSRRPSAFPSTSPTNLPTSQPNSLPSIKPSSQPIASPSLVPSLQPAAFPSGIPSEQPQGAPTVVPSKGASALQLLYCPADTLFSGISPDEFNDAAKTAFQETVVDLVKRGSPSDVLIESILGVPRSKRLLLFAFGNASKLDTLVQWKLVLKLSGGEVSGQLANQLYENVKEVISSSIGNNTFVSLLVAKSTLFSNVTAAVEFKPMEVVTLSKSPTLMPVAIPPDNTKSPVAVASILTNKGLTFQAILSIALVVGVFSLGGFVCIIYNRKLRHPGSNIGSESRVNPSDPLRQDSLDSSALAELLKVTVKEPGRRYLIDDDNHEKVQNKTTKRNLNKRPSKGHDDDDSTVDLEIHELYSHNHNPNTAIISPEEEEIVQLAENRAKHHHKPKH